MGGISGSGVAHISLPIPTDASLVGGKFFLQGLFIDSAFPFSLVTTKGLGVTLAQSIAVERAGDPRPAQVPGTLRGGQSGTSGHAREGDLDREPGGRIQLRQDGTVRNRRGSATGW